MRAVLCKRLEGPEALVIEDVPAAEPGPGEIAITVRVAALNFFDTLITRGKYQHKPELPFSPAGEIAGVVARVGDGVAVRPGERVAAYLGWGGAREEVIVSADAAIPIPPGVTDEVAAGVSITYGTAIHGLKDRANLQPGEWVAVTGAAGGAGLAGLEIAKTLGARVIAIASSEEKLALCRAYGADEVIDSSRCEDLKQALRDRTGGAGVDVIYDCVGGDAAEPALRALRWNGRFLVVGFASGAIPKLPLNLLLVKGVSAIGVFWGESVKRDPAGHRLNMSFVLGAVAAGRLKPHVHGSYPLERIREAIGVLDRREATGKVVLRVSGSQRSDLARTLTDISP